MAPVHSRPLGAVSLLAAGGFASSQLFVSPGKQSQAPRARLGAHRGQGDGVSPAELEVPTGAGLAAASSCGTPSTLAALALAGIGLAASHRTTTARSRVHRNFFASPKTEEVAPPPPPFDPAGQVGALAPLGYFDPMGYCKVGDEEGFRSFRAAELKHGRVAMMASIGAVAQHFFKFPIFSDVKGTFSAGFSPEGVMYSFPLIMVIAGIEFAWVEGPEKEPGNFGDPLGIDMYTTEMRNKELNNGRMAMISVLGIFAAEVMTGKDAIQQFGL